MIKDATKIVKTLQDRGYIAYFAGGSVRDHLLSIEPTDIDIATSATPEEIEEIFPNSLAVGKQYGVILVKSGDIYFDVATFRVEGPYKDKRRPDWIKFSSEQEDAKRRDFTINGLFFDPIANKIIDYVGGQEDIKKRVIRFIGNAEERIKEDNLRLIRAIRFKTSLNFQYEENTFEQITKSSELIKNVSVERLRDELNKIFTNPRRHIGFTELAQSKITDQILPEINSLKGVPQPIEYHHEGDVFTHTYLALKSLPADSSLHLVWAVLLHDIAKPETLIKEGERIIFHNHAQVSAEIAKQILKRLKFSNLEINTITWLIDNHMKIGLIDKMRATKRMAFLLDPRFPDLIELCRADSNGTYPVNLDLVKELENDLDNAKKQKKKAELNNQKTKLFNGDMLRALGYNPSKQYKEILDEVNDKILDSEIKDLKEAEEFILKKYKK